MSTARMSPPQTHLAESCGLFTKLASMVAIEVTFEAHVLE